MPMPNRAEKLSKSSSRGKIAVNLRQRLESGPLDAAREAVMDESAILDGLRAFQSCAVLYDASARA